MRSNALAFVLAFISLPGAAALIGCDPATITPTNIPDATLDEDQTPPANTTRGSGSGGRTPGTGPMSPGGALWSEAKTNGMALVARIKVHGIGGPLSDEIQVGRSADQFCSPMGIPVPRGQFFDGTCYTVSAVNHAARTFTITITRDGSAGRLTIDQNKRTTGP